MRFTFTRLVLSTALTSKPRAVAFHAIHPTNSYHASTTTLSWKSRRQPLSTLTTLRGGSDGQSITLPHIPLPSSFNRKEDVNTAILAVFAACRVTRLLQPIGSTTNNSIATISKQDASPVTIGDFASQATALKILHNQFPTDMHIAEEGSEVLRADDNLLNQVWDAVKLSSAGIEDICSWRDKDELLSSIDYGQGIDSSDSVFMEESKRRVWCLDPIDGTKGFLRGRINGGQYCIALALLEDGVPVVSILGCPNQLTQSSETIQSTTEGVPYGTWSEDEIKEAESHYCDENNIVNLFSSNRGCMFVAVRGCGCYEVSINDIEQLLVRHPKSNDASIWKHLQATSLENSSKTPSLATFCLGVERGFSDPKGTVLKVAQLLHGDDALMTKDGVPDIKNSFRMDGQGKYGILARGEAEYFLRLPKQGYVDWVWDVAAGYLILKEAGGMMTDVNGNHIDFSNIGVDRMAKLPDSVKGLLGSCGGVFHEALVDAYSSVESS